jgi:CubicO group peptidase (beta-lactamase class C family)
MQLAEQGKLCLDDPVTSYMPIDFSRAYALLPR